MLDSCFPEIPALPGSHLTKAKGEVTAVPHLYEIITDGELEAYIRSVIDRTHAALPTAVVSPGKKDQVVRQSRPIVAAEAGRRFARRRK